MCPKDGGAKSRKLWFAAGVGLAMIGSWLCTGYLVTLQPTFDTLVGGLLAIAGLFMAGNVSSKWVIAKANAAVSFKDDAVPGSKKKSSKKDEGPPVEPEQE